MKRIVKILVIILSVILVLFLWAVWYKYEYSMYEAKALEINSPNLSQKLLIATQGSTFKDSITNGIIDHYESDSLFIKVIDVSGLSEINPKDYTGIAILHTWENWKPPLAVKQFMEESIDQKDRIVVLTTSGQGSYTIKQIDALYNMENIDALAGESNLDEIPSFTNQIITKLDPILEQKE